MGSQLHVLGVVFLIAMLAITVLELRRDRGVARGLVAGLVVIAVLFLPLLAYELRSGFEETRLVLGYLRGGDAGRGDGPVAAHALTHHPITGWPLMGRVTDQPAHAALCPTNAPAALAMVPSPPLLSRSSGSRGGR